MTVGADRSLSTLDPPPGDRAALSPVLNAAPRNMVCWTVTDGAVGMETQCAGLADALGLRALTKRVPRHPLQKLLKPHWLPPAVLVGTRGAAASQFGPPWPDVLISCGYTAAACSIAVKRVSRGRTVTIHIQHPRAPFELFDLLVVPRHDRISGPNIITTQGAVHGINETKLKSGVLRFERKLRYLPRPLVAVLIGGHSRHYTFRTGDAERLARELLTFAAVHRAGLAVTVSPRTGAAAVEVLRQRLDSKPWVNFWDGSGENPYLGYLGLADAIVVTADSISMISEACATGKPVYVASLTGRGAPNIRNFYADFTAAGLIRPFDGTLERWRYTPLDETARAAAEVRRRLNLPWPEAAAAI